MSYPGGLDQTVFYDYWADVPNARMTLVQNDDTLLRVFEHPSSTNGDPTRSLSIDDVHQDGTVTHICISGNEALRVLLEAVRRAVRENDRDGE